jgi:hypothetical protein
VSCKAIGDFPEPRKVPSDSQRFVQIMNKFEIDEEKTKEKNGRELFRV